MAHLFSGEKRSVGMPLSRPSFLDSGDGGGGRHGSAATPAGKSVAEPGLAPQATDRAEDAQDPLDLNEKTL